MKLLDDLRMRKKVKEMLEQKKEKIKEIKTINDAEKRLEATLDLLSELVDDLVAMMK